MYSVHCTLILSNMLPLSRTAYRNAYRKCKGKYVQEGSVKVTKYWKISAYWKISVNVTVYPSVSVKVSTYQKINTTEPNFL